ncbi:MAG: TIGR00282 family metallophosphoesterase [Nitrospinae bacterium]|nr:TIGR00282 family metallophosphoesterase [Nitrospinota bacterium]
MRTLFIGDCIGRIGREGIKSLLPKVIDLYKIDFVIANGENLAGGFGVTKETAQEMYDAGVDVITSGNHIWDKKVALKLLDEDVRLLRPANYPPGVPGRGSGIYQKNGYTIAVLNMIGRVFMDFYDDPFRCADEELRRLAGETNLIFVDFHAEATSEKQAIGYYLDGRVTALMGTHTHVATADERILEHGTAYITDVGMAGPIDSVIGLNKKEALDRFFTRIPHRFMEVAKGDGIMNSVIVEADDKTGKAKSITRFSSSFNVKEDPNAHLQKKRPHHS